MDFHRDGKEGFANPFDLLCFQRDSQEGNSLGFSLERVQAEAQQQYDLELAHLLDNNIGIYKRIAGMRGTRFRYPKVWNPDRDCYDMIELQLARIKRVAPNSKGTFTFTGSLVAKYGRYLRMDALMSVYVIANQEVTGMKLNAYCMAYYLCPSTCRKWARDLLPLLGVPYMPGMDIWEAIRNHLKVPPDSSSFRQFFERNAYKATKGIFAAPT